MPRGAAFGGLQVRQEFFSFKGFCLVLGGFVSVFFLGCGVLFFGFEGVLDGF